MPQSLVKILVHIVFSTKTCVNLISREIEPDLFGYIHGIVENNKSKLLMANGIAEHVYLLSPMGGLFGIESARHMSVTFGDELSFIFSS